jgi:hypothetical protein
MPELVIILPVKVAIDNFKSTLYGDVVGSMRSG